MGTSITGMDTTARVRGVQYQQRAYGWNGKNAPRAWDGTAWSFMGIRGPTTVQSFTPTVAVQTTGLLTGSYVWVVVPVNTKKINRQGLVTAGMPSNVSAQFAVNAQSVNVSNIPATHADPQVDYWYIYRTLANAFTSGATDEGVDYHYVDKISIGNTAYVDNSPDTAIEGNETLRFPQMFPPPFKCGAMYGDRLFAACFDAITTGTTSLATKTITNKALSANVATITTSAAHGYSVGDYVTVNTGSHDINFDGGVIVTATGGGGTTFSYNRNNNNVTIASVAETGTTEKVTFAGVALPDGIVGCYFQVSGDQRIYQIVGQNSSTEIAVVGLASVGYVGSAFSAANYTIFRYGWQIYYSEFGDFEAWGPTGLDLINTEVLPGRDPVTALFQYDDRLWVYSAQNVYYISGKGSSNADVRLSAEAEYRGIGCVGPDAIDAVEGEIHFMSLRGPAVMVHGSPPQLYGQTLLTDWVDGLNSSDLGLSVVLCAGRYVYYFVTAKTGDAEVSKAFRYDRNTGTWWEQTRWHPKFGFHDDGDGGLTGRAYFAQGGSTFEVNNGFVDQAPAIQTGTITGFTTLSITDANANFPTATGGLLESYIEIFDNASPPNSLGARRINAQTGTTGVSWSATAVGGGALNGIKAGYTYVIGAIHWKWQTRVLQTAGKAQGAFDLNLHLDHLDANANIQVSQIYDNPAGENQTKGGATLYNCANKLVKKIQLQTGQFNIAMVLESYTGARVRQLLLDMGVGDDNKGV